MNVRATAEAILLRLPGRYFIHRHAEVDRLMEGAGYRNVYEGGIRPWRVTVYLWNAS